ncbi:hypothetical protein M758_5G066200 [Ceratodon purpureus]|nr:hypothetical protein M758_5G066200 [Ceratodon purpureus]
MASRSSKLAPPMLRKEFLPCRISMWWPPSSRRPREWSHPCSPPLSLASSATSSLAGPRLAVADKFGIPRYVLCASPAKVLASFLYTPELDVQGILPVEESEVGEIVHIPGL